MTVQEMQAAIGKPVYFKAGNLKFACWVCDAKISWGQPRFLIAPMAGTGKRWVEFSSIQPMNQPEKQLVDLKGICNELSYQCKS